MSEYQFTTQELETEEWRPVVGYEGIYSVSNLGRVRRDYSAKQGNKAGYILQPTLSPQGYFYVTLCDLTTVHKSMKKMTCHSLLATAFIGPRPSGHQINHIDGVKTNNKPSNLEYVTHLENGRHAGRSGLLLRGESHKFSKVSENEIRTIRLLRSIGVPVNEISKSCAIPVGIIYHAIKRTTWKHI